MGKEQKNEYYDAIYSKSDEYVKHYLRSRYLNLWKEVLKSIDVNKPILDIGCGPGQLAEMLRDSGVKYYDGIDFSAEAIQMAKDKNPNMHFKCEDIFKTKYADYKTHQVIICETLEHIEKDIELITMIRQKLFDNKFVFTVPTFDDPGHVRHFKSWEEANARFEPHVAKIERCERFGAWIVIAGIL